MLKGVNINNYMCAFMLIHPTCKVNAQNLVLNNGFEQHADATCAECYMYYGKYASVVYHWENSNWGCRLCDKTNKQHLSKDKLEDFCPFDKIAPQEGNSMVEMSYLPRIGGYGSSSHLFSRTTQPMRVGQLYEVQYWLYIPTKAKADPDWPKHIGVALLPEKLDLRNFIKMTRQVPSLIVDTVIYDAWYLVKWRVRPLCNSKYLSIGLFANDQWPVSRSFADVRYFVDNVSVREMPYESAVLDSAVYYCSLYYQKLHPDLLPIMDDVVVLYETNAYELTPEHQALLDSFAVYAKLHRELVFEVSGHTDSVGSDNMALSQNRLLKALTYLTSVHQIPTFRFIPINSSNKDPFRPNTTEEGRRLNRRVLIRQSGISIDVVFYQNALQAVEEKRYKDAFAFIDKWLLSCDPGTKIMVLFDPRFNALKTNKGWAYTEQKVRDSYRKLKYPTYAFALDSLRLEDRLVRGELSMVLNSISGYVPGRDSMAFYLPGMPAIIQQQKGHALFKGVSGILDITGWPKKSEFGESASASAVFLLQHALDIGESIKWLPELKKTCEEGEADWMAYAMVYDRLSRLTGKPQRYGTHVQIMNDGTLYVEPFEGDVDTVNDQRAKIGLPLLPDHVAQAMNRKQ